MSDVILKVKNISKQYRLGLVSSGTVSHDLKRWWYKLRGKDDPFLKIGEINNSSTKGSSSYVWALRDINFELHRGEVLGIIGKNGAGKSTLLKILSRVTSPTTGEIKTRGKIASLLEVGTGFHPEMTGLENIYLNGAILGMTKKEIASKIDEIIEFSGCQRYINTPVKRYSSGMRVRLAFAVAAHLEPDILVVDEVLAVGDAEFQKKAVGKMKDISKGDGRTVLFVSHNMAAVKSLCTRGLVLENGEITYEGRPSDAVAYYLNGNSESLNHYNFGDSKKNERLKLHGITIFAKGKRKETNLDEYDELTIETKITIYPTENNLHLTYVLKDETGLSLFTITNANSDVPLEVGDCYLRCYLPEGFLNIGTYFLDIYIIENSKNTIFHQSDIMSFSIQEGERPLGAWLGKEPGFIKPDFNWTKARF